MNLTFDELKAAVQAKGYLFFSSGQYNLNVVGIRTDDQESNSFNDYLCVAYNDGHNNIIHTFPITTDPGLYYRQNTANVKGTAIVVPGQHRGVWKIGKHQGKYKALVQNKPIKVFRDNDRDSTLDYTDNVDEGYHGINCHRANASRTSTQVDKWSAGCQVFANPDDFDIFMAICERAVSGPSNGSSFTYTLLEEADI